MKITRDLIKYYEDKIPKPWFKTPMDIWKFYESEGAVRIYLYLGKIPQPSVLDPIKYEEISTYLKVINKKIAAREYAKYKEDKHLKQVYKQSQPLQEPEITL